MIACSADPLPAQCRGPSNWRPRPRLGGKPGGRLADDLDGLNKSEPQLVVGIDIGSVAARGEPQSRFRSFDHMPNASGIVRPHIVTSALRTTSSRKIAAEVAGGAQINLAAIQQRRKLPRDSAEPDQSGCAGC